LRGAFAVRALVDQSESGDLLLVFLEGVQHLLDLLGVLDAEDA